MILTIKFDMLSPRLVYQSKTSEHGQDYGRSKHSWYVANLFIF